jgi:hypothetical protein
VLPLLLELGPPDLLNRHLTFPQLHAEWRHLQLTELLRAVWESCYPTLGDDVRTGPEPPRQLISVGGPSEHTPRMLRSDVKA